MNRFSLLSVAALASVSALAGCSADSESNATYTDQHVVNTPESPVKNQAIGNCWLYATGSWVESMHKAATGVTVSTSESYWSYWDWFNTISSGQVDGSNLQTGGFFPRAAWLIQSYGYENQSDFIPADSATDTQNSQQTALTAITASLATGALATPESRQNAALVRTELNKAWGLSATVVKDLDATFGADGSKTFGGTPAAKKVSKTKIHQASELVTGKTQSSSGTKTNLTLADFVGTGDSFTRSGANVWQEVSYPADAASRRQAQIRAQKAMNDGWTVLMSWYVDFNALDGQGHFSAPPAQPGRQGGHMTVLEDYEIANVPGFGTLAAGVLATPDQLKASLDPAATISFLRTKNSWGNYESLASMPGYFDIYEAYFDGPVQECQVDGDDNPIAGTCTPQTPLGEFVVPAGY
ncbi:MAG: hypothetical protein ABI183_19405 [Polyangiaceae bacterium]